MIKLVRGGHFCSKFENMVCDEFAICRNNLVSESIVALTPNNGHIIYLLDGDLDCILDILEEDVSFKEEVEKITTNVSNV